MRKPRLIEVTQIFNGGTMIEQSITPRPVCFPSPQINSDMVSLYIAYIFGSISYEGLIFSCVFYFCNSIQIKFFANEDTLIYEYGM